MEVVVANLGCAKLLRHWELPLWLKRWWDEWLRCCGTNWLLPLLHRNRSVSRMHAITTLKS